MQKVDLLNKKKQEIEMELNNCRKSLTRQNPILPKPLFPTNFPVTQTKPTNQHFPLIYNHDKCSTRPRPLVNQPNNSFQVSDTNSLTRFNPPRQNQTLYNLPPYTLSRPSGSTEIPLLRYREYPQKIISNKREFNNPSINPNLHNSGGNHSHLLPQIRGFDNVTDASPIGLQVPMFVSPNGQFTR